MIVLLDAREYFCHGCGHLRLSLRRVNDFCGNCGGSDLTWGTPGELNKEQLKQEFKRGFDERV